MNRIKVISQQPPGGRCGLYARYAAAIEAVTGWPQEVVHSETRDAHGNGFPSLVIGDRSLEPEDAFILTPEEIRDHLSGLGVAAARLEEIVRRLRHIHTEFIGPQR